MRTALRLASLLLLAVACDSGGGGGSGEDNPCVAACDERCGPCTGVVSEVTDGDTIKLEDGRTVRYLYVDTPETKDGVDCFGPEAAEYNTGLLTGATVTLGFDVENVGSCTDMFQRTLAYVCVGDVWVNEDLARRGYARKYDGSAATPLRYDPELDAAIADAEEHKRGGWEACDW